MVRLASARVGGLAIPLLVVLAAGSASAQPASDGNVVKDVQRISEPLDFDHVGTAEGLSQANVQKMVQDGLGFLWFGTQDGLARYDGTKIRVYRPVENDPTSISAGFITALAVDASGKLWVGTDTKGLNLYDPETDKFTRFAKGQGVHALSSEGVNAIIRDGKDRIWLAMTGGGLNRFDPATGGFVQYLSAPLDTGITAMDHDQAGNLWLGTADGSLLRWNPDDNSAGKRDIGLENSGTQITALVVARDGKVWVGTEGLGLIQLDPKTGKTAKFRHDAANPDSLSDDHITALYEDTDGTLWIGTHNGLNGLDSAGHLTEYHHDANNPMSLSFPWVTALFQDRGGVVWVGVEVGGVSKFTPSRLKFGHYRMQSDTANSVYEDRDGSLWVGAYHDGLYHYEWGAHRVTAYHVLGPPDADSSIHLDQAWISCLHRDRRGLLWIGTVELGLIAFDTATEQFQQFRADPKDPNAIPNDVIWDIWEDANGLLWFATWGGGLVRLDTHTARFSSITAEDATGLSSNYLYNLYPDPKDPTILWVGTAKGGVVRYDMAKGTATSFRHRGDDPNSLSIDDVVTMYREPSGALWVGTYGGGLDRLDPTTGKAERFTTANSALPSDIVFGILPGDDGKLWMSTNGGGLVQLDPATKKFLVYEASDGVQDNEFSQGSFDRGKDGRLYFGGASGFNAFYAKDIKRDAYVPPVVMTGLKVFNEDVKLDKPIWTLPALKLSYSDSFELQFAALSFAAPGKNRYAYKLEGFDDKFIETDRPYATYTKLDGGHYTLRVKAANEHGTWNDTGIALKISVTPPWWRTWPAFGGYVLILVTIVFFIFRSQRQKMRRLEREGRLAMVERDLELTGAVQSGFLPNYNEYQGTHLQLFGFYRAADACSGDWWWHEPLGGTRHLILVGDVTGHGPGPAMVTAAVATAFHVLAGSGYFDVNQALELLNRVVLHVAKGKYHMTMAALEIDEANGEWIFSNAGAPPILSLGRNAKHKVHFCAGTPLGTDAGFETGRVEGKLEPGERILIYTDGIPEIPLPNGNVLGVRRFAQTYEKTFGQPLLEAAATLAHLAETTQSGAPQNDDWTFTLIEWR